MPALRTAWLMVLHASWMDAISKQKPSLSATLASLSRKRVSVTALDSIAISRESVDSRSVASSRSQRDEFDQHRLAAAPVVVKRQCAGHEARRDCGRGGDN